tara:strand:+ start:1570 stop:1818 length:249 start_codon:yes stop_codon:yes gene_type:complete
MLADKFEDLLREYINSMGGLSRVNTFEYNTLHFMGANKKQFVSLVTKEVLFEVWLEGLPNNEYLRGEEICNPLLCWKEYYKV